jgi:RNA polymerase sigma-70 factor (ECF subfamily)
MKGLAATVTAHPMPDEGRSFAELYAATQARAFRTALAIVGDAALAADVTQDAYLAAFRRRSSFRGEGPLEAWLMRILVNAALSATRRRRVRWIHPLPEDGPAGVDEPAAAVTRVSLLAALQTLGPRERAAVVLRFYNDFDYATIARCLGTTTGTVGSLLSRAMPRLRAELEFDDDEVRAATPEHSHVR